MGPSQKLCPMSGTGAAPDGKAALTPAAMFNRTELVRLLLARGANGMTASVPRVLWGAEYAAATRRLGVTAGRFPAFANAKAASLLHTLNRFFSPARVNAVTLNQRNFLH